VAGGFKIGYHSKLGPMLAPLVRSGWGQTSFKIRPQAGPTSQVKLRSNEVDQTETPRLAACEPRKSEVGQK